ARRDRRFSIRKWMICRGSSSRLSLAVQCPSNGSGGSSAMTRFRRIVVLTGAGISAESGISTFRDKGGIWSKVDLTDVATPQGFARNPRLVLDFYNTRRKDA